MPCKGVFPTALSLLPIPGEGEGPGRRNEDTPFFSFKITAVLSVLGVSLECSPLETDTVRSWGDGRGDGGGDRGVWVSGGGGLKNQPISLPGKWQELKLQTSECRGTPGKLSWD